jgi:hypothetical protein
MFFAKAFSKKARLTENEGFGVNAPGPSPFSKTVIPGRIHRVRARRGPMTGADANPESRDSGFVLRTPRNDG